jgi:bifunctional non-homologous end joining protein LigD
VRTERLAAPGSTKQRETIDYIVVDDLPTLVWVANTASLELHTPQWRIGGGGLADQIVFDLDPGAPASIVECCGVALLLREAVDLPLVAKTSGSKGLQLYAAIDGATSVQASAYAKAVAQRLERGHPALVVSQMTKALRPGKILVDWSQNNGAKTTVSVFSLRARPRPTVSTPVSWDEVTACADGDDRLVFEADDVLARDERFAALLAGGRPLPAA